MPIPDFETLMLPVLRLASDGAEHSMAEMRERIAAEFKLTSDKLAEKQKSGSRVFANRLAWAVVNLKKAEILAPAERGVYHITDRGKSLLNESPPEITMKTLLVSFHKGGPPPGTDSILGKEPEKALTPDEQIERSYSDLRDALAHDVLEAVKKISPKAFERVVVEVLVAMGYGGALEDAGQVVGKSGDGGIDGTIKQDKLGLDIVYIQAKRWQDNVGSPEGNGILRRHGSTPRQQGRHDYHGTVFEGRSGIREKDSSEDRPDRRQTACRTDDRPQRRSCTYT